MASLVSEFVKATISKVVGAAKFPYNIGEKIHVESSIWQVYQGTRKDDDTRVTIFVFDSSKDRYNVEYAQNMLKRMKTMKHPSLLTLVEAIELDTSLYLITEPVEPLSFALSELRNTNPDILIWGIYSIANGIKFLNQDAQAFHGNLRISSVFISRSGEWKLGGMEVLSPLSDELAPLWTVGNSLHDVQRYLPPEISHQGWSEIKRYPVHSTDSWMYGCFVSEVFNGIFSSSEQAKSQGKTPHAIFAQCKQMLLPDPRSRLSVANFLDMGTMSGSFFSNQFIQAAEFLENITLKDASEKIKFFKQLPNVIDRYPDNFAKYKILPTLINALEFGSAGPRILPMILTIGQKHLSEKEYNSSISTLIIRLFNSPERQMRSTLLENIEAIISKMDKAIINDKIFPAFTNGFTDAAPFIREATVKAVVPIVPQLNDRSINNDLLRFLAKCQMDEESAIRANTVVCLGKICKNLSEATRKKVAIVAFVKSLKDPFPPSRSASLLALNATADFYDASEISSKILPAVSPLLIDNEASVRNNAFKSMDMFVKKLSENYFNPNITSPTPSNSSSANPNPKVGPNGWLKDADFSTQNISGNLSFGSQGSFQVPNNVENNMQPKSQVSNNFCSGNDGWDDMDFDAPIIRSPPTNNSSGLKLSSHSKPLDAQKIIAETNISSFPIKPPPKSNSSLNFPVTNTANNESLKPQISQINDWSFDDPDPWNSFSDSNDPFFNNGHKPTSAAKDDIERKKAERKAKIEQLKMQRRANKKSLNDESLI